MERFESNEFSTSNPWVKYRLIVETKAYSVEKNTTPVTVFVRAYRTNVGYDTYGDGLCTCKIDGKEYSESISWTNKINENGTVIFEKELEIKHNADGTKRLTVAAKFELYDVVSSSEQSATFSLPTIPRSSSLEFKSEFVLGDSVSFSIERASSTFAHKLFCVIAGVETMIADHIEESYLWDTGKWNNGFLWKASEFSDGFLYGSIRIYTFGGSNNVGSKDYPFTATVPNEYEGEPVAPSVFFEIEPYNDVLDETWESLRDNYIASISKVKVDFSGSYVNPGIGFGSYSVQIDGVEKGSQTDSEYVEFITDTAFLTSGSHVIKAIVRDKSGREAAAEKSITVDPYLPPFVSPASGYPVAQRVERTDDGNYVPSHRGESVMIRAILNFTELENNNQAKMEYQIKGGASGLCQEINGNDMDFGTADKSMASFVIPDQQFPIDRAFSIALFATDRIGRGNDYVVTVPVATPTAHAAEGGNGFALGMLATNDRTFRSQYQPIYYRPVKHVVDDAETIEQPFILDEFIDGDWFIRKWDDGTAECFGTKIVNGIKVNIPWGTMYESQAVLFDYPVEFEDPPFEIVSSSSSTLWAMTSHGTTNTNTKTKEITFARPSISDPENGHTVTLHYYVRGKINKENE